MRELKRFYEERKVEEDVEAAVMWGLWSRPGISALTHNCTTKPPQLGGGSEVASARAYTYSYVNHDTSVSTRDHQVVHVPCVHRMAD